MGRNHAEKSLVQQVKECLDAKLAIGQSKHIAKLSGTHTNYIFSWDTYRSYLKHACYFVKWCKDQDTRSLFGHKPRTLEECRALAEKWIKNNMERGLSAYTVKLQLSALAKLYGCKTTDFNVITPARKRENITRSRGDAARDKHFSISENNTMITFCKCTGLRRAELSQIRGTDLIIHEGRLCLDIKRATKGGRYRISPIIGSDEEIEIVKKLCEEAGKNKIFPKPNENADIHSYRAVYATRIYNMHKREVDEFKNERLIIYKNKVINSYVTKTGRKNIGMFKELYTKEDGKIKMKRGYRDVSSVYSCRSDLKGVVYDRKALFEASMALGHNRETVVAEHYLRA